MEGRYFLMNIKISSGVIAAKQKVVIYGPEGIGKSTFASQFPKPLFIDTEGSTNKLDVQRFEEKPSSWSMLKNYVEYVKQHPDICETLVIDTIDWAERLCVESILDTHNKKGIEDFGYGNGYTYVAEEIGRFLNMLQGLIDKNICNVVLTAHSQIKKFEQPDETGSYDRYELKLGKKTTSQTSPLVKEWADIILFANYETFAVARDKDGKKFKGQGGERVMFTSHHPCWDAKNRDGLPDKLPFDFKKIAYLFDDGTASTQSANVPEKQSKLPDRGEAPAGSITPEYKNEKPLPCNAPSEGASLKSTTDTPNPPQDTAENSAAPKIDLTEFEPVGQINIPENIPKPLRDLMLANSVSEEEIRFAVASKGYFPELMPIADYPEEFVNAVLVAAWEQVFAMIKENRVVPF